MNKIWFLRRKKSARAATALVGMQNNARTPPTSSSEEEDRGLVSEEDAGELLQVLQVFPDAQTQFVLDVLEREGHDVEQALEWILSMGREYPKETDAVNASSFAGAIGPSKKASCYDFMSVEAFVPSHRYILQSADLLLHQFPFLGKRKVKALLESSSNHFAIAHDNILRRITLGLDSKNIGEDNDGVDDDDLDDEKKKAGSRGTQRKRRPADEILFSVLFDKSSLMAGEIEMLGGMFDLDLPRYITMMFFFRHKKRYPKVTCSILRDEVEFVRDKLQAMRRTLEQQVEQRRNRRASILAGTSLVCSCCYDEFPFDEMVACRDEGHLFCKECISRYVESQLFSNGNFGVHPDTKEPCLEVLCCHSDGCSSIFDRYYLKKALEPKILQQYDDMQYHAVIEKAGLQEDMFSCPKCELLFEVPKGSNFFICPIETCNFEACRHCGEPPHIPFQCNEVEKTNETKARARVEEAASIAVIRSCPKCKKGIIKSDGCNKLTCACGTKFCYCCRRKISSYDHFCSRPHCNHTNREIMCDNKCPLYTKDLEAEDMAASRTAAMAEAARVEAESTLQTESDPRITRGFTRSRTATSSIVRVDVDSILRLPADTCDRSRRTWTR